MFFIVIAFVLLPPIYSADVCDRWNSVDIGAFLPNISAKGVISANGVDYVNNEYYYDDVSGTLRGCDCVGKICVRKCCGFGFGYDPKRKACVEVKEEFDPPVWNNYRRLRDVTAVELFRFVTGKLNCTAPAVRVRIGQATNGYHLRKVRSVPLRDTWRYMPVI